MEVEPPNPVKRRRQLQPSEARKVSMVLEIEHVNAAVLHVVHHTLHDVAERCPAVHVRFRMLDRAADRTGLGGFRELFDVGELDLRLAEG
jgi:hypothetical protein